MQLWLAWSDEKIYGVAITQMTNYPQYRSLLVLLLSGEDKELWLDRIGIMEDFARENGCKRIEAVTRKGMQKMLPDWKWTNIILRKELNGQ